MTFFSRALSLLTLSLLTVSCLSQNKDREDQSSSEVDDYYKENVGNTKPSKSKGTVGNGSLENGKLLPFSGENYRYFDTTSYLSGRGFLNDKVKAATLAAYEACVSAIPDRMFYIMECSNQNGGKMWPHKTHQNGLSIDFMMPLIKDGKPYYDLDTEGLQHYLLEFDYEGRYIEDPSISIDFEVIAHHILLLEEKARENGLHIKKIIIHTELKDELFAGKYGQELKNSGIYVVKALTPLINALHDDHYHIDFELL
jgi:penicillin-insensitive murein endopeptidase